MQNRKHFQKFGRGVFTCSICDRRTRECGQGNDHLCNECWELAGLENSVMDNGAEAWEGGFLVKERDALFAKAVKLGSNAEKIRGTFADLFPVEDDEEPVYKPGTGNC